MKKIIFTLALCVAFMGSALAQNVQFGATAGLNLSSITGDVEEFSGTDDAKFKAGFQIGVLADIAITENFSIVPELTFAQRGVKFEESEYAEEYDASLKAEVNYRVNYIQLPINAMYKFNVGQDMKVLAFAGPYLGYAVYGKCKAELSYSEDGVTETVKEDEKIKFGSDDDKMNAFDFGLNVGAGFQYTNMFFKLQYNLGLVNLTNLDNLSVKNNNFGVTVGYMF